VTRRWTGKGSFAELEAEARQRRKAAVAEIDAEARRLAEAGVRVKASPGNSLLRGRIALYRGQLAEERVVRLLNEEATRPAWLVAARRASREEDERGIDVVVFTADAGQLHLQVKSCADAAENFRRRRKHLLGTVAVIVAPPEATDAAVRTAAMDQLVLLHAAAEVGVARDR